LKIKLVIVFFTIIFLSCHWDKKEKEELDRAKTVLIEWNTLILELERFTAGYRPPVSARMYAYVQMCAYEIAAAKLPNIPSLRHQIPLQGLDSIAAPASYDLGIALNSAYAQILRYFFSSSPLMQAKLLEDLENRLEKEQIATHPPANLAISVAYGKAVANAIWNYAATDSIGHLAHLYNYDKNYAPASCNGCWKPTGEHKMPALLPHWGKARTFLVHVNDVTIRPPLQFDEKRNSLFYTEAMEVFLCAQNRNYHDVWVAEFWSDDLPQLTVTPVGRWFSILNQYVQDRTFPFEHILQTYLKLGLGLNDATIICWNAKYHFNIERPESYIQRNIQANWQPLHETPSFPAYPSGHSIFGALASEIIKNGLGDTDNFSDKTHEQRPEFKGNPRNYTSFDEMAKENAFSRLSMGVHYRMDCEEGYRIGRVIGVKVAAFPLISQH
jgi:hypothetical protein